MTAARAEETVAQRPVRRPIPARKIVVAAGAACALTFAIGVLVAAPPEPSPPATALAGAIQFEPPAAWRRVAAPPTTPGLPLENASAYAPGGRVDRGALVVGTTQASGRTLLPAGFLSQLPTPPQPAPVALGRYTGYRYDDLRPAHASTHLRIYVVPTSRGVATLVCQAGVGPAAGGVVASCDRVATRLTIVGARSFDFPSAAAYARRVQGTIRSFDAQRGPARLDLARARTPKQQAAAALRLAGVNARAAAALGQIPHSPEFGQLQFGLVGALKQAQAGYRAMASAAGGRDRAAFNAGRQRVIKSEASFDASVRAASAGRP
jgi:hypothetical protein